MDIGLLPRVDLDLDSLCHIADHLSGSDLLSLLRTCKDMYSVCRRLVLRYVNLSQYEPDQLRQFCSDVLADPDTRAPQIRSLEIHHSCPEDPVVRQDVIGALIKVLTYACNLETLRIWDFDCLLDANSRVAPVMLSLQSLRSLCCFCPLCDVPLTLETISQLRAPLDTIYLGLSTDDPDISGRLDKFAGSLVNLTLVGIAFQSDVCFPHIQSFRLEEQYTIIPRLQPLVHWFPNLASLVMPPDIGHALDYLPWFKEGGEGTALGYRQENEVFQNSQKNWSSLDYLEATVEIAWLLAIACPIRHIVLHIHTLDDATRIREAVRGTRTSRITAVLQIHRSAATGEDIKRTLCAIAASEASRLALLFTGWWLVELSAEDLAQALLASLPSVTLEYLFIDMNKSIYDDTYSLVGLSSLISEFQRLLEERLAREIFEQVPSLRCLLFRKLSTRILYTRPSKDAQLPVCQYLSNDEYLASRKAEGMQCSWEVDIGCSWPRERPICIVP
ncbi:hypothetical protein CERSUDRAFT_117946 [Gelatoporia subvermispora B]|uniref:F-box domain-containing protein n=1 Tax=Ceriporiopsis subvermispora (strain B) TaxID=914234 RepID=M2Q8Y6_CERS8|nr:hypothetical protein CERSUDRAFT_117946 [Gelatoporia subvermispora B]